MKKKLPIFILTTVLATLASLSPLLFAPKFNSYRFDQIARLPILEGGRVKPLDSFARNSLLLLRGTQSLSVEGGRTISAIEWLTDVLFKAEAADTYKVFVIDDVDVLSVLGLQRKNNERRYAYWQIDPHRQEIRNQAERAGQIESAKRSRFQTAVFNLDQHLTLYERIKNTFMIAGSDEPLFELQVFLSSIASKDLQARAALQELSQRYSFLAQYSAFKPIPPAKGQNRDAWSTYGESVLNLRLDQIPLPILASYPQMAHAFRQSDPKTFNDTVNSYIDYLQQNSPQELNLAKHEFLFNELQPFYSGMVLYILTLLCIFVWWARPTPTLKNVATGLMLAGFIVHTTGLLARMLLQGRPPVTNLYSSAIFVGWVAVLLSLFSERIHRKGFATVGGSVLGFCTLLIAHHLSTSGDTLEMMRAVLDSNFWLATHVVSVTIGYSSTFLAGALGITWVFRQHLVQQHEPETDKALVSLTYGVVAFSMLFSFVGTTLGGIWADQSWGRFWGWDPKENGALLIVLWNALILHARWAGMIRERGLMMMVIFGNIVTSLSWFGVNMLGIGLHSYGFMDKAFWWLLAFVLSQVILIVIGLIGQNHGNRRKPT